MTPMVYPKKKKSTVSKKKSTGQEETNTSFAANSAADKLNQEDFEADEHIFNEVEEYAIIMMDLKGNITSWNKGAEKIKGYTRQEIIGKNYRIFYTSEDKEKNLSEKLLS